MFAYCNNNPINFTDPTGTIGHIAAGALLGGAIGVVSQMVCNVIDGKELLQGTLRAFSVGAVGGGLTALLPGASTAISVGMSAAESVISDIGEKKSLGEIAINAALSAGFAATTSGSTVMSNNNIVSQNRILLPPEQR